MVRLPDGSWGHADASCEALQHNRPCRHGEDAKRLADQDDRVPDERAIVDSESRPLAIVREVNLAVVKQQLPDPGLKEDGTHPWIYQFKTGGKPTVGLSADGIQDSVRALAFQGETIRTDWVRMDSQDESSVYFLAAATRYCVSPDGISIALDSTIRGHKADKMMEVNVWEQRDGKNVRVGTRLQIDPKYFEKGVTKASRNAEEALLPEAIKVEVKNRAIAAQGGYLLLPGQGGRVEKVPVKGLLAPPSDPTPAPAPSAARRPGKDTNGSQTSTQPATGRTATSVAGPPAGAKWQDLTVGDALKEPKPVWATAPFSAAVEAILGEGKCRPAVLKVALSEADQPPLDDDTLNGMTLGFVVEMLAASPARTANPPPPSAKEEEPSVTDPNLVGEPPEEPPMDAEYSEAPANQEVLI